MHCIEWAEPPNITYGTTLGLGQLDATLVPPLEGVFRYYLPVATEPPPSAGSSSVSGGGGGGSGGISGNSGIGGNHGNHDEEMNGVSDPDGLILTVGVGGRGEVRYATFGGPGQGYMLSAGRHALKVIFTPATANAAGGGGGGGGNTSGSLGGGSLVVRGHGNSGGNGGEGGGGGGGVSVSMSSYEKKVLLTVERARTMIHWPPPPEADARYPLTARHLNATLRVATNSNNDNR